jgi:hypothetical protein
MAIFTIIPFYCDGFPQAVVYAQGNIGMQDEADQDGEAGIFWQFLLCPCCTMPDATKDLLFVMIRRCVRGRWQELHSNVEFCIKRPSSLVQERIVPMLQQNGYEAVLTDFPPEELQRMRTAVDQCTPYVT